MKYSLYVLLLVLVLVTSANSPNHPSDPPTQDHDPSPGAVLVELLREAYPGTVSYLDNDQLVLASGEILAMDQSFLNYAHSLVDLPYPALQDLNRPPENTDPGRVRWYPLFEALYGRSVSEVEDALTPVDWLSGSVAQTIHLHRSQNITRRFARASRRIMAHPDWESYSDILSPVPEPFNWRTIADSTMLSTHSFAIAFDLHPWRHSYWLWDSQMNKAQEWQAVLPVWVVHIFESEGFVWGGRWHHYDTMHFEYRPEVILSGGGYILPMAEPGSSPLFGASHGTPWSTGFTPYNS